MVIENIKSGTFYLATAPSNYNSVIIYEVGTYGPLKVLANSKKYFQAYEPTIFYFNGKSLKKITKVALKKDFLYALKTDPAYFTSNEITRLSEIFKVKIPMLASAVKGWQKEHNNYNKSEKWERSPAKRKTPARNIVKAKKAVKAKKK